MRKLMSEYAAELIVLQHAHDARRNGYRSMRRIASGRKGIRHIAVNDADLRHRKARIRRQIRHQAVKLRCLLRCYLLR